MQQHQHRELILWAAFLAFASLPCAGFMLATAALETAATRSDSKPVETIEALDRAGKAFARLAVGPDRCSECHGEEFDAWETTEHAKGFSAMHRSTSAKSIAAALGIRRIKRDPRCVRCHYTQLVENEKTRVRHGVSCESCHGPGREWIAAHNDTGVAIPESMSHRQARIDLCIQKGMRRPDRLHDLARSCYECHVIDDEKLVNLAGHRASAPFELVTASQGSVRHNFLASEGEINAESPIARRRAMFVLGRVLEVEFAVRALALATEEGAYRQAHLTTIESAVGHLEAISRALGGQAEIDAITTTLRGLLPASGSGPQIKAAIEAITASNRRLAKYPLETWSSLGALLPGIDEKAKTPIPR